MLTNLLFAIFFFSVLPVILLLSVVFVAAVPSSRVTNWLTSHQSLVNGLASLFTILSVSFAMGTYFIGEYRHDIQQIQEYQALLDDFRIEIGKNRGYCSNFSKDKNNYLNERQFPLWSLHTTMLQKMLNRGPFHDETFRLMFELYNITIQYNELIRMIRTPELFPNPQWDTFNRSTINSLSEKTNILLKGYEEIEAELRKVAPKVGLTY